MAEFKLPTETVDLPSKGILYSEDNPLSSGKIEMKYMTAKEEDILTNQAYIQDGTVFDRLFKSLIVSKINYNDLLIGDKNAILVAARILGYGKDYTFTYNGQPETVDLTKIEDKPLDESLYTKGQNKFNYQLPHTGTNITFKILNHKDEQSIKSELNGLKKINKNNSPEITTRLKYLILAVDGNEDKKDIREYVDNFLLARDAKSLRNYAKNIQPDVDLTFFPDGNESRVDLPIGLTFFWPDN
tara:strand:+ start:45 stop:773 length:729 start_codon:yes stop_codon:yes gene_type:complete